MFIKEPPPFSHIPRETGNGTQLVLPPKPKEELYQNLLKYVVIFQKLVLTSQSSWIYPYTCHRLISSSLGKEHCR